jgi:hypothetical protein
MLVHLGLWSGIGLAAGLAFGLGRHGARLPRLIEAALAGLVAAVVGVAAFEVVGAIALPMSDTSDPFPLTAGARLLARLFVALFVAVGVMLTIPRPGAQAGPGPA